MTDDQRCRTCKWWADGDCSLAELRNGSPVHPESLAQANDGNNRVAYLYTSPDFGCVQWEKKTVPEPVAYLESADGTRWPVSSYETDEQCDVKGMAFTNFRIVFTLRVPGLDPEFWIIQLARLIFPKPTFEIRTSLLAIDSAVACEGDYLSVRVTLRDRDRVSYVTPGHTDPPEEPVDLGEFARLLAASGVESTPARFNAEGGIQGKAKRRRK